MKVVQAQKFGLVLAEKLACGVRNEDGVAFEVKRVEASPEVAVERAENVCSARLFDLLGQTLLHARFESLEILFRKRRLLFDLGNKDLLGP